MGTVFLAHIYMIYLYHLGTFYLVQADAWNRSMEATAGTRLSGHVSDAACHELCGCQQVLSHMSSVTCLLHVCVEGFSQHVWFSAFTAPSLGGEGALQTVFGCMMWTLRRYRVSCTPWLMVTFGPLGILMLQVQIPLTLSLERRSPVLEEQKGCCMCAGTAFPAVGAELSLCPVKFSETLLTVAHLRLQTEGKFQRQFTFPNRVSGNTAMAFS